MDREKIIVAFRQGQNITAAAQLLGITRQGLMYWLRKYGAKYEVVFTK